MATDPASLLAQAACYNCFGSLAALELALYGQWMTVVMGGNPGNLVPPGAMYGMGALSTYNIPAVIGGVYQWTRNADDTSVSDNASNVCTSNCSFTAGTNVITLAGFPGTLVTAILVRIS